MGSATTKPRIRISSRPSRLERLAVVFADPIRLQIVAELYRREMSPSQFHNIYGGGTLSRVDRHFKRLAELGWLRHVWEDSGGHRRGGTENFYRATELAIFDNETWAQLPPSLKAEFSWRIFEQFAERVKHALEANTFDARADRHFTWSPLILDELGRSRAVAAVDSLFESLFEEEEDATARLTRSRDDPIYLTVGLAAFDSPSARRNRSGLQLARPGEGDAPEEVSFGLRAAKVFSSPLNLKIVTESGLRRISPSQFHAAFGGGSLPAISRRFNDLAELGWLTNVGEESGGRRRGATETFYRASKPAIFDTRNWSQVPEEVRQRYSWRIFEQLAEQVREAMDAGTFDARPDRHNTWIPLVLDERGWKQVIAAVDRTFYLLLQEQDAAKARLAESGEEPLISTVYLAAFESPQPPKGTALFHTPF